MGGVSIVKFLLLLLSLSSCRPFLLLYVFVTPPSLPSFPSSFSS